MLGWLLTHEIDPVDEDTEQDEESHWLKQTSAYELAPYREDDVVVPVAVSTE